MLELESPPLKEKMYENLLLHRKRISLIISGEINEITENQTKVQNGLIEEKPQMIIFSNIPQLAITYLIWILVIHDEVQKIFCCQICHIAY